MLDYDNWLEIWQTVRRNKLRTILTVFGVFWGIFMLVIMLGTGNGLENGVYSRFGAYATNSTTIWGQTTTLPYLGMKPGRDIQITLEDVLAIQQEVNGIEYAVPRNQLGGWRSGFQVTHKTESGSFSVMGDYPEIRFIQPITIDSGRFINALDIQQRRKVAIIGSRVADVLFEKNEPVIGSAININQIYFTVVGIFSTKQQAGDEAERFANTIFTPFSTFQQVYNFGNKVGWFSCTATPNVSAQEMETQVLHFLALRHKVAPDDQRAFGAWNMAKEFTRFKELFVGINYLVWIVGIGTLAAGTIGLSNIMLIVVKERTKEIGIRKALGATPFEIISTIVQESMVLTSVAGYAGLLAAVSVLSFVSQLAEKSENASGGTMFSQPSVSLQTVFIAIGILTISAALAALIPARAAASVNPTEALRNE